MTATSTTKTIGGVTRGALPWWFINGRWDAKSLLIVPNEEDVAGLVDDMQALFKLPSDFFSLQPFPVIGYPVDDEPARPLALYQWMFGKPSVLIASQEGLALPADSMEQLSKRSMVLKPGLTVTRPKFEDFLTGAAFLRNERVEQVGEYAIRGEVTDIWPAGEDLPLRVVWHYDTVESLRVININTERSEEFRSEVLVCPVSSVGEEILAKMVSEDTNVILFLPQPGSPNGSLNLAATNAFLVTPSIDPSYPNEGFEPPPLFAGHIDQLRQQLIQWHENDWRVAIFCHNAGERSRLEELLEDRLASAKGLKPPWLPPIIIGEMEHGFLHPLQRLAVLSNSEIFGRYRKRIRLPKFQGAGALSSPLDLQPSDLVVHEKFGIGRYMGLKPLRVGSVSSEFLSLQYKGGDKVYVPIFEIQQVQKYLGAEDRKPGLSSLDTAAWERIKSKAKEDVAKVASELLRQAAKRNIRPGYAFPEKTHLEEEFAASFMYKLTHDQMKTLEEVEKDMMSPKAMDRLICGDVGFGKTEVAMRAALKAALAAKQVALLCPTTILAEQHARNFTERLVDYPVTVRLLSRFQDKSEQKKVLEMVAKGGVDIVIGTHRLLSADVGFKDLGLIIIDEEHRFGVKQKHKLMSLRETVDVLSLTATPIPRTLASSLSGIKDLSVIETPPEGRLPISTHAGPFDEDLMVKAVQAELDRGGQVFYVHNRVKTLLARQAWLKSLMPSIRIVVAHGQMKEAQLEKAMHDFLHKNCDVLLATTIIESGLDIPSVNTLIVEEAEEMGLAQLYQLRGRVGRSRSRAYCYLFYSPGNMTTDAKKRLDALKEFTALGSGLRLAMRDMEIRGAGNLLGPQQHGTMAAVGIETYSRLLQEEIQRLKGQAVDEVPEGPLLELSISAYIPEEYLPSEPERVRMYKRILSAHDGDLPKLQEELVDRCGNMPGPVETLFRAASLRLSAKARGISQVHEEQDGILIYFRKDFKIPEKSLNILLSQPPNTLTFIPGPPSGVRFYQTDGDNPLDILERFLTMLFGKS